MAAFTRRPTAFVFCLLAAAAVLPATPAPAAPPRKPVTAPQLDRRITQLLLEDRLEPALSLAERGVQQYPQSWQLRLRLAQCSLRMALALDAQLEPVLRDVGLARGMESGIRLLLTGTEPDLPPKPSARDLSYQEGRRAIAAAARRPEVTAFIRRAELGFQARAMTLSRRTGYLKAALSALEASRIRGGETTEVELTRLWSRILMLFWYQEANRFFYDDASLRRREAFFGDAKSGQKQGNEATVPAPGTAERQLEVFLEQFAGISPALLYEEAIRIGLAHPADPLALAGAADALFLLGHSSSGEWEWIGNAWNRLDRCLFDEDFIPEPDDLKHYRDALRLPPTRFKQRPLSTALQFYWRAAEADPQGRFGLIQLRAYYDAAAFDQTAARKLLNRVKGAELAGVRKLEEARYQILCGNSNTAWEQILSLSRERAPFRRSALTAVPLPLRRAIRMQPEIRDQLKYALPGYEWLWDWLRPTRGTEPQDRSAQTDLMARLAGKALQSDHYGDRLETLNAVITTMHIAADLPLDRNPFFRFLEQAKRLPSTVLGLELTAEGLHYRTALDRSARETSFRPRLYATPRGASGYW